jgi:plasmid stability protein
LYFGAVAPVAPNGAMPSIQIKGVPERTHAVLRMRAAAAHQSLQEYLLQHLIEEADRAPQIMCAVEVLACTDQ